MFTPVHCIALRSVAHSDTRLILTAWSRELGRIAFAVPAGASREARRRRALTAPLALFEGVTTAKPGHEVLTLRDFSASPGSPAFDPSPVKAMTACFIAEVLDMVLRTTPPDERLWEVLHSGIIAMGGDPGSHPAFHLLYIYKVLEVLGVGPDMEAYTPGAIFDLREARWRLSQPLHPDFVEGAPAADLHSLATADYSALPSLSRLQRASLLETLLLYYNIHLAPLNHISSLQILRKLG